MAIIVIGGGERGAGKTSLVCGLIRALSQVNWIAVKITSHDHGRPTPIWEETAAGQQTDTARYLAAGARRALLVTASDSELGPIIQQILERHSSQDTVIFESNRVLRYLRPDVCLAAASKLHGSHKPTFQLVEECMDATVTLGGHDHVIPGDKIHFHLASLERISAPMQEWLWEQLRDRLKGRSGGDRSA
jgi:hypothetical protein